MEQVNSINEIDKALKELVLYHNYSYEQLEQKHRLLYNKVINYHNRIKNTNHYDDFFIKVKNIFRHVNKVQIGTIGYFFRSCSLALDNSNSDDCQACKGSLRPARTSKPLQCACAVINYTDEDSYEFYPGINNKEVLVHISNSKKNSFSIKEVREMRERGHEIIKVIKNVDGNNIEFGPYKLKDKPIDLFNHSKHKNKDDDCVFSLSSLVILMFIFLAFILALYVTKKR